jgi:hypothetical protein
MVCVTTRFRLRHPWDLARMYFAYLRMRQELRTAPGLLRHAFLIQSPVSCLTMSVWESEEAHMKFSSGATHVAAVRLAMRLCPDIWSAYWRLDALSRSANRWQGIREWPRFRQHHIYPHLLEEAAAAR